MATRRRRRPRPRGARARADTPTVPADTTPVVTTPPADTTTTDTTPPPDTTPSNPPAPATVGRVDNFTAGGPGGSLHVIFDSGANITGYVLGSTTITCDTVSGGQETSSGSCAASSLASGQRVVRGDYTTNSRGVQHLDLG